MKPTLNNAKAANGDKPSTRLVLVSDDGAIAASCGGMPSDGEDRKAVVARVYREHNEALLRYLGAKLSSPQDAQDVAQEAFVRMLRLDEPEAISHLQAFLFKIAKNIAIDRLRQRARCPETPCDQEGYDNHACGTPAPDAIFSTRQELETIRRIIAELPAKCRQAFLLYKFEGLEYGEIAVQMELSESMVRKYVLRAVAYCKKRLNR